MSRNSNAAFETVMESHLLASGYIAADCDGFDEGRAVSPDVAVVFIHKTLPKECVEFEVECL